MVHMFEYMFQIKYKIWILKKIDLVSSINEKRFSVQHESCECKYGLNESACNWNKKWNLDECGCECKELDGWSSCKYMWF